MKLLFIHRSVGNNLINDSHFYDLLAAQGVNFAFSDYDNNSGILRGSTGSKKLGLTFPNNNTKPSDYAELFCATGAKKYRDLIDMVMSYDIVAIKSCYPNSNIKSDQELESIKGSYRSISRFFINYPQKKLIILTSPPLRGFLTSTASAKRARMLANWLTAESLGSNISVFDLFDLLASDKNVLKREYTRLMPLDNHPNATAAIKVAPKLIAAFDVRS